MRVYKDILSHLKSSRFGDLDESTLTSEIETEGNHRIVFAKMCLRDHIRILDSCLSLAQVVIELLESFSEDKDFKEWYMTQTESEGDDEVYRKNRLVLRHYLQ